MSGRSNVPGIWRLRQQCVRGGLRLARGPVQVLYSPCSGPVHLLPAHTRRMCIPEELAFERRTCEEGAGPHPRGGTDLDETSGLRTGAPGAASHRPVSISSGNGVPAVAQAVAAMRAGVDTLEAAVSGVVIVENDPDDTSVGFGGLPNFDGVVELDACVMHGPTRRAGAVAALQRVANPSRVAQMVMERSDHILLVGDGALQFARMYGFPERDLLTDRARQAWVHFRESLGPHNRYGPGVQSQGLPVPPLRSSADQEELYFAERVVRDPPTGTITCLALNEQGEISGVTSTSGHAWKLPGRVGDSPLIGCGLFVDSDVGAAGATGRGEECIKVNGAHTVVESMRHGASPEEACREALRRMVRNYQRDPELLRRFDMTFYALSVTGDHAAVCLWSRADPVSGSPTGVQYALGDPAGARLVHGGYLLERSSA
jgi:N4-(beta-N-acetylglucosaminyl)-L-asparaginase